MQNPTATTIASNVNNKYSNNNNSAVLFQPTMIPVQAVQMVQIPIMPVAVPVQIMPHNNNQQQQKLQYSQPINNINQPPVFYVPHPQQYHHQSIPFVNSINPYYHTNNSNINNTNYPFLHPVPQPQHQSTQPHYPNLIPNNDHTINNSPFITSSNIYTYGNNYNNNNKNDNNKNDNNNNDISKISQQILDLSLSSSSPSTITTTVKHSSIDSSETASVNVGTNDNKDKKQSSAPPTSINFTLNGNAVTVANPDPLMTLNEYIRTVAKLSGTKLVCGEGGCGACTVTALVQDPVFHNNKTISLNSCLRPLCAVDGMNITTIEGIGSQRTGFHPIQERLADNNGSQCGYCSPGFVMNMYSLVESNSAPTQQVIENQFDGNICRCTGYRPILAAMKTFAVDHDTTKKCNVAKEQGGTCCSKHFFPDIEELIVPKYLKYNNPVHMKKSNNKAKVESIKKLLSVFQNASTTWYSCTTLPSLYSLLSQYSSNNNIKLVVGNTSIGIFKNQNPNIIIDIHQIPDLLFGTVGNSFVSVGSAVSINDLINLITTWSSTNSSYPNLATHLGKVANNQVRNVASWAGNIMLVNKYVDFPSDVCLCLLTYGATLTIGNQNGATTSNITIDNFLTMNMNGNVILSVQIPFTQANEQTKTFKVALRHENSHAIINAGFRVVSDPNTTIVLSPPTIAFGGLAQRTCRMPNTEKFLVGKPLNSVSTLQGALTILQQEAKSLISTAPGKVGYRLNLVTNLFYKGILGVLPSRMIGADLLSVAIPYSRGLSSGIQSFTTQPTESPVSLPIPKLKSRLQTSGGLKYTGDSPLSDKIFGSFVQSTIAWGDIESIDPTDALNAEGVIAFIGADDVIGLNSVSPGMEVFVSKTVQFYGQGIGLIVADTKRHADEAVLLVKVQYTNIQSPILTLDDAIASQSFFPEVSWSPTGAPVIYGDINTGFQNSSKIVTGKVSIGSQIHFHMEQHITIAEPTETGGLDLKSATQLATNLQQVVATCVNLPINQVSVGVTSQGGGYGGKLINSLIPACAASVAALSLGRPVVVETTLNQTFEMLGHRNPMLVQYQIGVNNSGILQAGHIVVYTDYGSAYGENPGTVQAFLYCVDNCYFWPNFRIDAIGCKTNLPPNCAMRGPGWVPAVFMMEHIMEHVALEIGMDVDTFRSINFYKNGQQTPYLQTITNFNIPTMWSTVQSSAGYAARKQEVATYNTNNKYTKRGLALTPVKFGIGWTGNQFGVLLNVMPDGTVNVVHSGVEIGQGIDTKVAQVCAYELGIPLSSINIIGTSTLTIPNASGTGGSVTSCLNSQAMINASQILLQKLAPVKQTLGPNATWQDIIAQAYLLGIDLQSKGWVNPPPSNLGPWTYNSFVTVVTDVLVDVLTGEVQVLRADILFDCGISTNPAIDIGQVEGAFVQGLGYYLTEELLIDQTSSNPGALISNGTWEYKPPSSKDIPIDFRVTLLANTPNPVGVLGSKGSGEPPLASSCSAFFAVKHAIQQARIDLGLGSNYFPMNAPATVDNIQTTCLVNPSNFNFQ